MREWNKRSSLGYEATMPQFLRQDSDDERPSPNQKEGCPSALQQMHGTDGQMHEAYSVRCASRLLISATALPGLRCFGQVLVQFMIVWQRKTLYGSFS